MPTEEELEQRITDHIDKESADNAILSSEIESLKKAVKGSENISGLHGSQGKR